MKVKVYHYSRCATCRRVIDELYRKGIELELRDIFKDRLSKEEIKELITTAGINAREALRKKHKLYKDIIEKGYSDDKIVELMANDPSLIERPIIITDGKVFIRPEQRSLLL